MNINIELRIIQAVWFILPAYIANLTPVNVSRIKELEKYGKPIDFGKSWGGVRILGDGKTWRGLFSGVAAGTITGLIQSTIQRDITEFLRGISNDTSIILPRMSVELAFMLSLGALFGDMVASFVKRRTGLKRGDPAPLLDQLDFVFGAFFFAWLLNPAYLDYDRFFVVVVITPMIHVLTNFLAYLWKLKKHPW
ncbi:MAG: CDP-2,3-bis-(O-geranylgeranyl)-sn-glycerol synthase [Candidatus Altiarchaeales archaeon]|nr:MAG: CDP-2,3-bis-(O-geranylgeranyl)-sn-glycerol synthase [Candidatus Altiarchaeales archaeon]